MSQKVLTVRQAKNKINTFGKALILYVIVLTVFRYGIGLFEKYLPGVFLGHDPVMFIYIGLNILLFLLSFIPFALAASKLDLNLKDYYKKVNIPFSQILVYSCYAIGINLITTSLMSVFSFFFNIKTVDLSFIGKFTSSDIIVANIAYLIYMIIVKPFCDEYAFRGVIQRSLGNFGRYFGVFGSAILYTLAQGNIVQAIPAFFIGWYLSSVSLKHHSIRPTIMIQSVSAIYFFLISIIPSNLYWVFVLSVVSIYIFIALNLFLKHRDFSYDFSSIGNKKIWDILFSCKTIIFVVILFIMNVVLSFISF